MFIVRLFIDHINSASLHKYFIIWFKEPSHQIWWSTESYSGWALYTIVPQGQANSVKENS